MSFHLMAYTASVNNTVNLDVAALTDDIMYIANSHFVPPVDLNVYWIWAAAATLSRARLNSGKIRQVVPNYIRPINLAALPATNPNIDLRYDNPLVVRGQEELQCEVTDGTGTTERFTCVLAIGDGLTPAPRGDFYNVRVTSTTTATANAWTTVSLVYETGLPAGQYVLVGGEMQSTNIQAFRMIFDGQYFRPGTIGISALGNREVYELMNRQMGVWGTFRAVSLPRCQVLANAADAAFEGYLSCIRVGA